MKRLSVMIKPASSACNMRCRYCFYADESERRSVKSYGVMTRETAAAIVGGVYYDLRDGDRVSFAFQGGEPTLAGLAYFERFVDAVNVQTANVAVSYALQTNGLALDEGWCAFLKRNGFLVGLSLDGYAALHNANRVDNGGAGTFAAVMRAKRLLEKGGVAYNALTVLTNEAARHPLKLWNFIQNEGIQYAQFIPCLGGLGGAAQWQGLSPNLFYAFYSALYPLWKRRAAAGRYISVKLFEDIADWFIYGRAAACGIDGQCRPQFVVEADGGVYPCDFYALDEYRTGDLTAGTLREAFESEAAAAFRAERGHLPQACGGCAYAEYCGGGCKRQRPAMCDDEFCGFRALLDEILSDLARFIHR